MAFVNNVWPPFTDVLEDFKHTILEYFDVEEEDIKQTNRSLGFRLHSIDFDLLPATNMAKIQYEGWFYFLCFSPHLKVLVSCQQEISMCGTGSVFSCMCLCVSLNLTFKVKITEGQGRLKLL